MSTLLLCLACYPVAWVCDMSQGGNDFEAPYATVALVLLLGLDPFFLRRNHRFSLAGLLLVTGIGLGIAGLGWLFGVNLLVLAWLGMTFGVRLAALPTGRGTRIQERIEAESGTRTAWRRWLNPPTEQAERMLAVKDLAWVLAVGLLLLCAGSAMAGTPGTTPALRMEQWNGLTGPLSAINIRADR